MRLVIIYTVGDGCTYSAEVVEPLNYESVQAAKLDFGSKLLEISEAISKYEVAHQVYQNQLNSISSKNVEKKMKLKANEPKYPQTDFDFGGRRFQFHSFVYDNYDERSKLSIKELKEPDFYTIDEWFKKHALN